MSNKVLEPLEPFLKEIKETSDGLTLIYINLNQKTFSYSFDVISTLTVVQSLKIKIKYKGKKYYIRRLSQQETREKATIGVLGRAVTAAYLTGPATTTLTIILEEIV